MKRKNPEGYKELLVYKKAEELRQFVFQITEDFPRTERRRKEHMRDSARSVKQNLVEGWKKETTQQYIDFLSFSFGSLGELKEDGKDCLKDSLISQAKFEELKRRCGELDYLMRRLKEVLERKIQKSQVLSPYQRWLRTEMEKREREEREIDEELKKIVEEARKGKRGEKGERGEKEEKRVYNFLILLICFSLLIALRVKAEQEIKLFVSPEMFELEVERGEQLLDKIKIRNKSQTHIPIRVSTTNFGAQEESGTITFYQEPPPRDSKDEDDISYNPRKWIKIENPEFILDPGELEEVRFEVNIPENAEPGGKYTVVLFEPQLPSFYFQKEGLKAIPKIGVLFLFSVKVEGLERAKEPLTVVEFAIPENLHLKRLENLVSSFAGLISEVWAEERGKFSIVETSHLPFTLRIRNNDIYHLKPEGNLAILKDNGRVVGETEIKKTTILPGKLRRFPVEFKPTLPEKIERFLPASISEFISKNFLFGKYRAHLFLTTKDDIIEKDIEFWVFPWKIYFSTTFVICILLFILIKYRKRIKSATKALVGR